MSVLIRANSRQFQSAKTLISYANTLYDRIYVPIVERSACQFWGTKFEPGVLRYRLSEGAISGCVPATIRKPMTKHSNQGITS